MHFLCFLDQFRRRDTAHSGNASFQYDDVSLCKNKFTVLVGGSLTDWLGTRLVLSIKVKVYTLGSDGENQNTSGPFAWSRCEDTPDPLVPVLTSTDFLYKFQIKDLWLLFGFKHQICARQHIGHMSAGLLTQELKMSFAICPQSSFSFIWKKYDEYLALFCLGGQLVAEYCQNMIYF